MSNTAAERVARGVEWLNENLGQDWPDFIDTEKLNLRNGADCILGQLFDGAVTIYNRPVNGFRSVTDPRGLGMGWDWAEEHGFLDGYAGNYDSEYVSHATLQEEWLKVIDDYELETA